MKTALPLLPHAATCASPEVSAPREAAGDGETFASVLDRLNPAGKPRMEHGETASAESEVADPEAAALPHHEEESEAEERPEPPPTMMVALPALPYHPVQESRFFWNPIAGDAPLMEAGDESLAGAAAAGISAPEKPAQNAAAIFAGQGQSLPLLTAMFPIPMAQLQAQLRIQTAPAKGETSLPGASAELRAANVPTDVAGSPLAGFVPEPTTPAEFAPALPRAPYLSSVALPDANGLTPQQAHETAMFTPVPPREFTGATTNREETWPAESTQQTDGTSAAKRGEVMQAIAFQASPKPRVAKSAGDLVAPLESAETPPAIAVERSPESSATPSIAPAKIADDGTGRMAERRIAAGSNIEARETPSAPMPASVGVRPESSVTHSSGVGVATTVDSAGPKESAPKPGADLRMEIETGAPANFQPARPQADRVTTEAVATEAPISRTELVQIVERTADAAVRMRASGSERLEVAVQLENGDRLSIQLRIANGEVTPYFRTSSEGLRTALEQNWTQFSDRANDRGVRLTPPVFDVHQSSSNMSDLSQQRHGRDPAYTDAQAELFPHLPRRMRPPRVLASAPLESSSATTAGVRTYA